MSQRRALVNVTADSRVVLPLAELKCVSIEPKGAGIRENCVHELYHINSWRDNLDKQLVCVCSRIQASLH